MNYGIRNQILNWIQDEMRNLLLYDPLRVDRKRECRVFAGDGERTPVDRFPHLFLENDV